MPNILICDDDPTARFLLKRVLVRELNANVTEAPDGLQALKLLTASRYDVLILDLRMPVMDGGETLDVVRGTPELRDLPVIVLSGETDAEVVKRVVHAGVTDFLLKPLARSGTQQRLMQIIERLRGREPSTVTVPKSNSPGINLSQGQTLLIADPAEDFRYFCRMTLGRRFNVIEATTGLEAFDMTLVQTPAAVLIGRGLTLLGSDALAKKIRSVATHPVAILAVAARGETAALTANGLYDGCMVRTFVAEAFEQQLEALGFAATPLARLIERAPELRTTVISATEQVFGMMVKMDVEVRESQAPFVHPFMVGRIPLSVADEFEIQIDLSCTEESANVFAVAMFGVPEPAEVLAELANIVAGRVKQGIVNRGLAATLGLPDVKTLEEKEPGQKPAELATRFGVIATPHQLEVSLRVRERSRSAASAAPSAGATAAVEAASAAASDAASTSPVAAS